MNVLTMPEHKKKTHLREYLDVNTNKVTKYERKGNARCPYFENHDINAEHPIMVPRIGGGTANVPRERKIGTIAYVASSFGTDLFGPNGGLPLLPYEYWVLRLSGTLTADALADGTIVAENPRTLIKAVQVVVTGLTGDTFIDLPLTDLVVLSHYIGRRPSMAPDEDPVTLTEVQIGGAITFYGEYAIPFNLEDMANPYRGMFAANRYAQVRLRVQWGNEVDFIALSAGTVTLSNTKVDVWVREYAFEPRFETATDLLLHQRTTVRRDSINAVVLTDFDVEIPRTAAFLRGILLKQYTSTAAAPETAISTLLTGEAPITLLYNDTDRKYEFTHDQLRRQNRENYARGGVNNLPTGYTFLDLSPKGDFSLLQNLLNLQKMVVRVNTASVANAILRTTLVKYAASA